MLQDNRTKPHDQWSYYVVDNLPTMANLYRFDTVEEAIEKYKSLPDTLVSAIGSSIHDAREIDHIHRCDGKNVLVTDCDHMQPWVGNSEIQESIDKMIAYLNVQYQYSHIFSPRYPSVIVDLERYRGNEMDHYFDDKLLRPENPKLHTSCVKEVYVEGEGWLPRDSFLKMLENSRPGRPGEPRKNVFVDMLNIDYIDKTGRCGQADISPRNFNLLMQKTLREISPDKLAEDLYQFASDQDPFEEQDQADTKGAELHLMKQDIDTGNVSHYVKYLTAALNDGSLSEEDNKTALSLLSRLTVLTPSEFRKPALMSMIQNAEHKASQQPQKRPSEKDVNKER